MSDSRDSEVRVGQAAFLGRLKEMIGLYGVDTSHVVFNWSRGAAGAWVLQTFCGPHHFDVRVDEADLGFHTSKPAISERYRPSFERVINEIVNRKSCPDPT